MEEMRKKMKKQYEVEKMQLIENYEQIMKNEKS